MTHLVGVEGVEPAVPVRVVPAIRRREFCHSAAPPSAFVRRSNRDGEGAPVKCQNSRRAVSYPSTACGCRRPAAAVAISLSPPPPRPPARPARAAPQPPAGGVPQLRLTPPCPCPWPCSRRTAPGACCCYRLFPPHTPTVPHTSGRCRRLQEARHAVFGVCPGCGRIAVVPARCGRRRARPTRLAGYRLRARQRHARSSEIIAFARDNFSRRTRP